MNLKRKFKLEELELDTKTDYTTLAASSKYRIKRKKTGATLFIAYTKTEVENWLQENLEVPANTAMPTKMMEAIARAFSSPR